MFWLLEVDVCIIMWLNMCIVYLQGVDVNVLYYIQSTLNQRNHEIKCLLLWPNGECYNQSPLLNEHIATCFF